MLLMTLLEENVKLAAAKRYTNNIPLFNVWHSAELLQQAYYEGAINEIYKEKLLVELLAKIVHELDATERYDPLSMEIRETFSRYINNKL